jgi:hypothetical protein
MFSKKSKFNLFTQHSTRIALGFVMVALAAGIYFLFKPFPAGPSLEVKANQPEAASVAKAPVNMNSISSVPSSVREFVLAEQRNFRPSSVNSTNSVPNSVREFVLAEQRNFGSASLNSTAPIPGSVREFVLAEQRNFMPSSVNSTASIPGSVREISSNEGLSAIATIPASAATYIKDLNLVPGFSFETSVEDGQNVAQPILAVASVPDSTYPRIQNLNLDIGSGYILITGPDSWTIMPAP